MQIIKRKMEVEKEKIESDYTSCQASFNSDGVLTLRQKSECNQNEDIITVFSRSETKALIDLFFKLKENFNLPDIPF